jgi:hypothetical protein
MPKAEAEKLRDAGLILETIGVRKELDAETVRENALYILSFLSAKYGPEKSIGSVPYKVQIQIKEKPILKDYSTLNSVSLEIILYQKDVHTPAAMFLLSDETHNTVSSYTYLFEILETAVKRIYR